MRLPRHLRGRLAARLPGPDPGQPVQRGLLAARHRPGRAAAAPHPQRDGRRRADPGERQGRVQPRPARDRLPVRRGAGLRRPPRHLQERRQGDRRPGGHGDHLHGQAQRARGQLLPHPLLAARRRRRARRCSATGRRTCRAIGQRVLAGLLATMRELSLLFAPNINSYKRFQPGSFAPTALRWGARQPHLRAAAGRARRRAAGGEPGARRRRQPVPGDRRRWSPAALHGIEQELELGRECTGNAYDDAGRRAGARHPARGARRCGRPRRWPREAFGDEVVAHYANSARVELAAFDAAVTDWELIRGFERL